MSMTYLVLTKITVKHKTAEIIIQVQAYALTIRMKEKSIFLAAHLNVCG